MERFGFSNRLRGDKEVESEDVGLSTFVEEVGESFHGIEEKEN
jgi:hypothetical protein